jgi:ABC-type antimicrobial peptide transport system permease subunit
MNLPGLALRNLSYHWRGNLSVLLGMAVGTAVLTGALLVGDSLRGSLASLSNDRLGWVDQAVTSSRFFRADLADKESLGVQRGEGAIILRASVSLEGDSPDLDRGSHRVTLVGVDEAFWPNDALPPRFGNPQGTEPTTACLNAALARALHLETGGGAITLHLPKSSDLPRESLLGRRGASDAIADISLNVTGILDAHHPGANFSLEPGADPPRNLFVPLAWLQEELGLPKKVNTLLVRGSSDSLAENFKSKLILADYGLTLRRSPHGYVSLESQQLVLSDAIAETALATAGRTRLRAAKTLSYLANRITEGDEWIPYSVVAALDPALPPPLGPFLPQGIDELQKDDIILVDWKDSPLAAKIGDTITLTYYAPEESSDPRELPATFTLRGTILLEGPAADPGLTPSFPGITDKLTLAEWNPPFSIHNEWIQKRDDQYWKDHRATPKAYVTLAKGQEIWGSRFGKLTSIRLASIDGGDLDADLEAFRRTLLQDLKPEQGGFEFQRVREEQLKASAASGTNFSVLFLLFSTFLIGAALLLVGLLFHLNLDRRAAEVGVLLATGYRRWTLFFLLLSEGAVVAGLGGLAGCAGGAAYAWLLLEFFRATWPGLSNASFLQLHVSATSLAIGFGASLLLGVLTQAWALRGLSWLAPAALIAGVTTSREAAGPTRHRLWARWVALGSVISGGVLTIAGFFIKNSEAQAGTFFGSGGLMLVAGLALLWTWMRRVCDAANAAHFTLTGLSVRNGARNPLRSLLTAGLLASAAFLIVAVELFRRQPDADFLAQDSGSGGFALLGESEAPVYPDLHDKSGHEVLLRELDRQLADQTRLSAEQRKQRLNDARALLARIEIEPFRLRAGDDASCLSLYQPRGPRVRLLGTPASLIKRGGFRFSDSVAETPELKKNPWLLLNEDLGRTQEGEPIIPVVGEQNTLQWILRKGLGDDVETANDKGEAIHLRIVGYLQDSVFQSGLLMSDANFREQFPGEDGYRFFLIDTKQEPIAKVQALLGTALQPQGFEAELAVERVQSYQAVENLYLTTFQALGALGLLLGAIGLAVVLLRSVWERRGELALLRALGYRHRVLGRLLLLENALLLLLGLVIGVVAAVLAVAPHLVDYSGPVPWLRLPVLLGLVMVAGLGSAAAALAATLRAPLLPALRRE